MVDPNALPGFRQEVRDRIWSKLEAVLRGRERYDVFELIVEATVPPLPDIDTDWRARDAQTPAEPPSNQGRRERARGDHPERDGLAFGSPDELAVYDALVTLAARVPAGADVRHRPVGRGEVARRRGKDAGLPGDRQRPRRRGRGRRATPLRHHA
jgi:hypothetical protein